MTNMDKLYEAVEARGPVCVGLDTDFSYLPADFVDSTLHQGREHRALQQEAHRCHQGRGRLLQGADRLLRVSGS